METHKEQVRALEAELQNKRAILERQRKTLEETKSHGSDYDLRIPKERVRALESQIEAIEQELEKLLPLAQVEPEPSPIDVKAFERDYVKLLTALSDVIKLTEEIEKKHADLIALGARMPRALRSVMVIRHHLKQLIYQVKLAFPELVKRAKIDE